MSDYLLFVDETKPTVYCSDFCFAGIVLEREYYEKTLIPLISSLKQKHFGKSDIIFHHSEMRKNKNSFSCLQNETVRNAFWSDYVSVLSHADFEILSIFFDDSKMKQLHYGKPGNNYNIGFYSLLDMFTHYLRAKKGRGHICVESRTFHENRYLLDVFYKYLQNGSVYFAHSEAEKYISSIGFTIKGDNCIGLQIVDMIPSQMLRYKANMKQDFYQLTEILSKKIYQAGTEYEPILGLKNIL